MMAFRIGRRRALAACDLARAGIPWRRGAAGRGRWKRAALTLVAKGNSMSRVLAMLALAAGFWGSSASAQDLGTIRVGWTIPAEESKYWMMRRPQEFPGLGKTYKVEWSQFQGTSVMAQALAAGAIDCATQGVLPIGQGAANGTLAVYVIAQHVGERPGSFSVYRSEEH